MQTALIIMTILGCDDTATQCHYVETLDQRWANIQVCDAEAGNRLKNYSNIDYPVVVAVCQSADDTGLTELAGDDGGADAAVVGVPAPPVDVPEVAAAPAPEPVTAAADSAAMDEPMTSEPAAAAEVGAADDAVAASAPDPGLTRRVLRRVQDVLPETARVKSLIAEPVHFVTESYSWVAQRFDK